jgi:cytochrome c biogenesis protein
LNRKEDRGLFSILWGSLSSLRFTIPLLIILAVVLIFGTVIPQNASVQDYLRRYSVPTYRILKVLGFLDLYHALWFVFLLALLSLNLMACSLKRFRTTVKFFRSPEVILDATQWKALSFQAQFQQKGSLTEDLPRYQETLSRFFGKPRVQADPKTGFLFAEKMKWSRLGVYCIHGSVLIILAGALIGSFFGFRGNLNLVEGQASGQVILREPRQTRPLGFDLRLDKFEVSFYSSGAPREFKSTVTILEEGREVKTESIRVNHPLTYRGISFYQSNYGLAGAEKIVLSIRDQMSGKEINLPVKIGMRTEIPGSPNAFLLTQFIPDFQGMGPAFPAIFFMPNRPHENFMILQNHPEVTKQEAGPYLFSIHEMETKYYSGLQVTKDPGVWVVWAGCFLMIAGFYMTFFMSHRRIWVKIKEDPEGVTVEIAGASHRDRSGFEKEFKDIQQAFENLSPKKGMGSEEREAR